VGLRAGEPERYPVKSRKLKRGRRENALLWLDAGDRLWLSQRPATGVWAGLWSLPEFDDVDELQALAGSWPGQAEPLATIEHALTHFDWTLRLVRHRLPARLAARELQQLQAALPAGRWVSRDEALALGLPAPVRKLLTTAM
jgi:A/G-specific adenine glycosylase